MNDTQTKQPILDTLIQSRDLQMLKAMVPYLDRPRQRTVSMVIRLAELQKTMQLFQAAPELEAAELHSCENNSPTERTRLMLYAVKDFCTPQEAETIDNIVGFSDMYNSYETMMAEGIYDIQ